MRILLVQLGSTGDCLLVTPLLRQIKLVDYPNSHITWMICSAYKHIVENNPYLDNIIEISLSSYEDLWLERMKIDEQVENLKKYNNYDKIIITDYYPKNFNKWYCTTRSSLLRAYPQRLTVDVNPDIFLTKIEKDKVRDFCSLHDINASSFNILIESSPRSGQSSMNQLLAIAIAENLTTQYQNLKCIISSSEKFTPTNSRIIDGSFLSFRETKEILFKCNLLLGSSSAISWMCSSSTEFINLRMIQLISRDYENKIVSASLIKDFKYFGLPTKHIIELTDPSEIYLLNCIYFVINNGFVKAKKKFGLNENYFLFNSQILSESYMKLPNKIKNNIHRIKNIVFHQLKSFIS